MNGLNVMGRKDSCVGKYVGNRYEEKRYWERNRIWDWEVRNEGEKNGSRGEGKRDNRRKKKEVDSNEKIEEWGNKYRDRWFWKRILENKIYK